MTDNTIFRILHKTESDEGIYSVIDKEPLEERGINPKEFKIGEMIIKNEDKYYNVRSLYVPDNFTDSIKINPKKIDSTLKKDLDNFIKAVVEDYSFSSDIYDKEECLNDFNIRE